MKSMTTVLAINGSPRKDKGNTAMVLAPFIEGMEGAGATTKVLYAAEIDINDCLADFNCWFENPGECIQKDGMQELYPEIRKADILVLAIPVYIPVPAVMQKFLNRLCPIIAPELTFENGRTRGKKPDNVKLSKIVLVSTGGWWEVENMSVVLKIAEELSHNLGVDLAAAVLRPHAFVMREKPEKAEEISDALRNAGRLLVEEGAIPGELLETISAPLLPEEELRERYNSSYRQAKGG
jgi:multimeric flavodoxin WrbA